MFKRSRFLLIFFLLAAAALTFFKVPLASSQGVTIVAGEVSEPLPLEDPDSALWSDVTAVEVPLSAQNVALPRPDETSVRSVTVRALHDGESIAMLVEWEDETRNDEMVRVQDFRDAVAVQFPLDRSQPFFCMGQQGGNVNIWHWKADWEADMVARRDVETAYPDMYVDGYTFAQTGEGEIASITDYTDPNYLPAYAAGNLFAVPDRPSSVEDIIAGGFGTLTSQGINGQNVKGFGEWLDGRWRVIFSRALHSDEVDDVVLTPGRVYSIAFAAWDGEFGERNGEKSTSQWISLRLARPSSASAEDIGPSGELPLVFWLCILGMVLFMAAVLIIVAKLPEPDEA